jgi:hypothetical protein
MCHRPAIPATALSENGPDAISNTTSRDVVAIADADSASTCRICVASLAVLQPIRDGMTTNFQLAGFGAASSKVSSNDVSSSTLTGLVK